MKNEYWIKIININISLQNSQNSREKNTFPPVPRNDYTGINTRWNHLCPSWNLLQVSVRLAIYFDQQMTKSGGSGGQEAPAPAPVTLVCPLAVSPLNTSSGLNPINTDTEPPAIGNMVIICSALVSTKYWTAQFTLLILIFDSLWIFPFWIISRSITLNARSSPDLSVSTLQVSMCQLGWVLLEYTRTAMFHWMFLEVRCCHVELK